MATDDRVLLIWQDGYERQAVYKILCATGAPVDFSLAPPPPEKLGNYRLIVIDFDSVPEVARTLLEQVGALKDRPAVLVLSSVGGRDDLSLLLSYDALTHLIAKNTAIGANELVVTAQKILRNDIFLFEKYLTWGAHAYEHRIESSDDKERVLDSLEEYLLRIGCNRRLIGLARGVGDEFIMNAVYNAPVDASGAPKYASRSRAQRVRLEPSEGALFRYACDGRSLALSICDRFGRLERSTIRTYLQKGLRKGDDQIDQKQGGAGLGLYYIFESLNKLVINLAPDIRTEFIGIMDISGTYRDFVAQPKSLSIFTQETKR